MSIRLTICHPFVIHLSSVSSFVIRFCYHFVVCHPFVISLSSVSSFIIRFCYHFVVCHPFVIRLSSVCYQFRHLSSVFVINLLFVIHLLSVYHQFRHPFVIHLSSRHPFVIQRLFLNIILIQLARFALLGLYFGVCSSQLTILCWRFHRKRFRFVISILKLV